MLLVRKNTYGVTSKDLADKISSLGKDALYIPDFNDCVKYLKENIHENDIVITQGAGTVTEIGPMLFEIIKMYQKDPVPMVHFYFIN